VIKLIETLPEILKQAAQSQLGTLALMTIILGIIGYIFFRKAGEKARLFVFVILFAGVAAFAVSISRVPTLPAKGSSDPAKYLPATVKQRTTGPNSPAVSGVGGDVNFSVNSTATDAESTKPITPTEPATFNKGLASGSISQQTQGTNSPAIQGVQGSVKVTIDHSKKKH